MDSLKFHFNCHYEEKDSIGKRYRRQDAIGTYCVTVDHDTLKDNHFAFQRYTEQERVDILELRNIIEDKGASLAFAKEITIIKKINHCLYGFGLFFFLLGG